MEIQMSKFKPGIYAQRYVVLGEDEKGRICHFMIYRDQAKNYAQAVRFWNRAWGKKCKAFVLRNAEPMSYELYRAC
jgi:hypothetical protein